MINGLTLVLLNFSYFICNFYPKHLLEFNGVLSIVGVLLNLVFYFIFALFLIVVFNKNKNPFSENIFSLYSPFFMVAMPQASKKNGFFPNKIYISSFKSILTGVYFIPCRRKYSYVYT